MTKHKGDLEPARLRPGDLPRPLGDEAPGLRGRVLLEVLAPRAGRARDRLGAAGRGRARARAEGRAPLLDVLRPGAGQEVQERAEGEEGERGVGRSGDRRGDEGADD